MRLAAFLPALLACACSFDPHGEAIAPDAIAPCEPAISVDGTIASGTARAAVTVLPGDTVTLSASCAASAHWSIDPPVDTIAPAADASTITLYAVTPGAYTATLGDKTVYAFDVESFVALAPAVTKVRDLTTGAGLLWIGGDDGLATIDLAAPVTATPVAAAGAPGRIAALVRDDARAATWIGGVDTDAAVYRLRDGQGGADKVDTGLGSARVTDLELVDQGAIAVATDAGIAFAPEGSTFTGRYAVGKAFGAVGEASAATWALGATLDNVDDGNQLAPFASGTGVGLVGAGGAVWASVDGGGVARVDGATGAIATWDATTGLPTTAVRGLAADGADVWVATQKGLARWKADRAIWVDLGGAQGLGGHLDLRDVVITAEPRAVFAGGAAGLVYAAGK